MRYIFYSLNIFVLVILGFFAKDNLIAEFKYLFSSHVPYDPSRIKATGSIEVAFSPNAFATISIIRAISEAKKLILVSAYTFTSSEIARALLEAKRRNVSVKIILDKSQKSKKYSSVTFFINQDFEVRLSTKYAIFHNKFMIIDDKTLITGSFNFTKAAETKNAENVLIIRENPKLAEVYTKNWWHHWNNSLVINKLER